VIRELNTFELAERERLSREVLAGFIKVEDPLKIVRMKIEAILFGVIHQGLAEIEHFQTVRETRTIEQKRAMIRVKLVKQFLRLDVRKRRRTNAEDVYVPHGIEGVLSCLAYDPKMFPAGPKGPQGAFWDHMLDILGPPRSHGERTHVQRLYVAFSDVLFQELFDQVEKNLEYLTEIVIPHVLELSFLDGLELTVESTLAKYLELTRQLTIIENMSVPSYNSEQSVKSLVEWDQTDRKYKIEPNVLREWKRSKVNKD